MRIFIQILKVISYQVVVMARAHIVFVWRLSKCMVSHETMFHTLIFPLLSPVTKCLSLGPKQRAVIAL